MVRATVFFSSSSSTMRILLLILLLFSMPTLAQRDSSVWLRVVDIQSRRFDFSDASMSAQTIDTSTLSKLNATTLADRLHRESALFVKSYGSGSLSTISIRGTGAAHSAVLWNGISLNSPMLGLYDFTLLPMFLLDDVKVQAGGNGPLVGSGGVGGAIFMDANLDFRKRMQVKLFSTFGSFGQMQNGPLLLKRRRSPKSLLSRRRNNYTPRYLFQPIIKNSVHFVHSLIRFANQTMDSGLIPLLPFLTDLQK